MKRRSLLKSITLTGMATVLPWPALQNLSAAPACDPTTSDILGPFYLPNQPFQTNIAPSGAPGTPLFITGTVYGSDCATPLKDALVDVWQANDGGQYENNNYRGRMLTDASGNYAFSTILPGKYLNGPQYRPRHIHYKSSYPQGQNELTTQLYFQGDTSIPIDPWASDPSAAQRIIPLTTDGSGNMHGVMDIILNVSVGIEDHGKSEYPKGLLLGGNPNPFKDNLTINYYLPAPAAVQLVIYDILGREVIKKDFPHKNQGQHQFVWNGLSDKEIAVSPGVLIAKLFMDGEAVDAKRFLKV